MNATTKVRVPARVARTVLESDAAANPGTDALADRLVEVLRTAPRRADGARHVVLDDGTAAVLREYADVLAAAAADSVASDPGDSLADLRAARAVLRALDGLLS